MTNSATCPICEQPIHLGESTYSGLDRRPMEHLSCHVRWSEISAKVDGSADPAYGPMS